jgi:hypothetical protein
MSSTQQKGSSDMQLLPNSRRDHIEPDDAASVGRISALSRGIRVRKSTYREVTRRITAPRRCRIWRRTMCAPVEKGAAGESETWECKHPVLAILP